MDVPAEAGGETLYTKSEAALVGQTLQKILRTSIVALILLLSPIAACQHHHVTLRGESAVVKLFLSQEAKASFCSSPSAASRRWLDSNG